FGMDFGIMPDGRLVLFEANATMNFFPFLPDQRFAYVKQCASAAKRAFHDMLGRNVAPVSVSPNQQPSR
ncbi:MAG TPA: hypothetical protein VFO69_06400, partial [Allosphingosinicella sp.]|nr:hypothetical protein [Allosphingosinicella sp.]